MAVIMNIILQYVTRSARRATNICPKAHPIDRTIGVAARDISLITSVKLSREALKKPLKPALKKNIPIAKM
jgi:hypothetical protein